MPLLRGDEPFRANGALLDCSLLDYWRWSGSDLLGNAERGVLAEFLVASALGALDQPRREWDACDIRFAGLAVEVKSAAWFQSWHTEPSPSAIQFGIAPKKETWDAETNQNIIHATPRRLADVYVFCLLGTPDGVEPDPFDLDQWQFFVLPTTTLDREKPGQKSITLNPLRKLVEQTPAGGAVPYHHLRAAIEQLAPPLLTVPPAYTPPMPFTELEDARLYYEQHGNPEGDHVVFVHGAGGNALSWWQQLPVFGERYRCTVYDARGWGRSTATGEHDRGAFGRDLAGLLEELDIDRAHVIAQSMGGRAVAGLLRLAPERARSLVLCGTTAGATNDRVRELQAALRVERGSGGLGRHAYAPHFPAEQPARALLHQQIRRLNPPRERNVLGPPPANYRGSTHQMLIDAGVPVAFIVGEHDLITSPELIREASSLIPGADFLEMKGAGHSTYFEHPDAFNAFVLAFLDRAQRA